MASIADYPWLVAPWEQAVHAIKAERMPAGVLIVGRPGLGRTRLADAIVRASLCLDPRSDAAACGSCSACREMDAGAHPDCLSIVPEEGKASILVEQIRGLSRALSLTASAKGVRCALIAPADALTEQAANALLKTLEEPSAGVTLILVADSTAHLLPTVISRCLRLRVPTPDSDRALAWLQARHERRDWSLMLALCGGAPLAAEQLAQEAGDSLSRALDDVMAAVNRHADPLKVADNFSSWPLPRFATLIGCLAWAVLRAEVTGERSSGVLSTLNGGAALAVRANERRLLKVWDEACMVANDAVARNDTLAREWLILLFVHAFDSTGNPRSRT